jgi:energy-coupling factor transporter transmembrane protein EcfT
MPIKMNKSRILILLAILIIISGFLNLPEVIRIFFNVVMGTVVFILSAFIFREYKNISSVISMLAGFYLFVSSFLTGIAGSPSAYLINNLIAGIVIDGTSNICFLRYLKAKYKNRHIFHF